MRTAMKRLVFVCLVVFICGVDFMGEISPRMTFVGNAEAIIGLPFTPLSCAGVARRTTRRLVATEAAVATTEAAAAAYSAPPPSTVAVETAPPSAAPAASAVPIGTVVQALPGGCTSVAVNDVNYSDCGGVYYKAAFQGNNLVYVVVQRPMQ
jgi:hypothetical protein